MPRRLAAAAAAATVALLVAGLSCAGTPAARADSPPYTVTSLTFTVTVPNEVVTGGPPQQCTVVGDLYKPAGASPDHRVPAILTTNGFGGSKDDQAWIGRLAASRGYAVLSYSGLGFGGSGCKISLDDPAYDGAAGSQLVSFLGGKPGIATDAGGAPYTVDFVQRDATAHDGQHHDFDPRVGMVGGSYGGEIQFAIASVDPRLDTIVPVITWNDLAYSLAPNNTALTHGVTYADSVPGTEKLDWVTAFFGLGFVDGLQGFQTDPTRELGCPNFLFEACRAKAEMDTLGYPPQDVLDFARHASVESYIDKIDIPTLLLQGEADSLFNLNESVATYRALRARGVPVKLIWQSWGHSNLTPAKGEYSADADALSTYEGQRVFAWFDHYLKGEAVDTGPGFAFFRDWVPFSGDGPDTVQYAAAPGYPAGTTRELFLSGSDALVADRGDVKAGKATYSNLGLGAPTSYSETSAVQGSIPDGVTPPSDAPGTFAAWSTPPLRADLDVAGVPVARVRVSAPTASAADPATMLQLFAKIYDIAPDGSKTLVHRLVSPVRAADLSRPVTVRLPGIVHRFPRGHRLELVLAASDAAYKNSALPQPTTVSTDPQHPSTLTLPVLSAHQAAVALGDASAAHPARPGRPAAGRPPAEAAPRMRPVADASSGALASTGGGPVAPALAAVAAAGAMGAAALRRRRTCRRGR